MRAATLALLAVFVLVGVPALAVTYTGTLSAPVANGIDGTGFWVNDPNNPQDYPDWTPATISWVVSQNQNQSWNYAYEFQVYRADVSHFILEVSEGFGSNDLFNVATSWANPVLQIGWHDPGSGNPSMPTSIYGIKFDDTVGTTVAFSFDSWRVPVWGDFYAKCGATGGTQNAAWNAGFAAVDPTLGPYSGSEAFHILVPDTEVIPEIPSSMLAGLGAPFAFSVAMIRRRLGKH
jgi:hypothetical protein